MNNNNIDNDKKIIKINNKKQLLRKKLKILKKCIKQTKRKLDLIWWKKNEYLIKKYKIKC